MAVSGAAAVRKTRTPTALVVLITEILEPFAERLLDPASGSGGMDVQSARFVKAHRGNPAGDLAIHGLEGKIPMMR